jgi:hypothetical protein
MAKKVKVVLMEDLLADKKIQEVTEQLEKRKAILEKVYTMGTVIDKGVIKSSMYFIVEE